MILLDLNQIVISCFIGNSKKKTDINLIRHAVLNKIRFLNSKYREPYGRLIICCDSLESWRKTIYPYYKARRKANRSSNIDWDELFAFLKDFKTDLRENFPYKMIEIGKAEADDIIAVLSKKYDENHLIVSSDRDFYQLHSNTVQQISPFKKDEESPFLREENPLDYLFEKIVRGDPGDGIPNIYTEAQDIFLKVGARQKSVTSAMVAGLKSDIQTYKQIPIGLYKKFIIDNFYRNMKLINFNYIPEEISSKIIEVYEKQETEKTHNDILNYLISRKMKILTEHINDF